jgi:hypothetical protein
VLGRRLKTLYSISENCHKIKISENQMQNGSLLRKVVVEKGGCFANDDDNSYI